MSLISRFLGGRSGAVPSVRIEPQAPAAMAAATSGAARPDPAFWGELGWGQSRVKSLPVVTPAVAERHATVFACGNVISGDLAKLPILVMQRGRRGRDVEVYDHPLGYLLNVEASPGVAAMVARFALVYAYAIRGRSYAYAPRDGAGELTMIDVIRPDMCSELEIIGERGRVYDFEDGARVRRRAVGRNMVHLRYMAEDGWTGRSPLQVAAESMGLALAGQEAAARAASGTQMRAFAKMAGYYEDDEDYRRAVRRLRGVLSDPAHNGVPIVGPDDDIKSLELSAADQELLASREFDREQIAAVYRVPPSKLMILRFGVKANGEQQAIDYKADCLSHWGGLVEAGLCQGLLTEAERRSGLYLVHNYDALLEATTKERFEAYARAVGGPWMTWREVRELEGLDNLPEGEAPYPPANMTRKDDAGQKGAGA